MTCTVRRRVWKSGVNRWSFLVRLSWYEDKDEMKRKVEERFSDSSQPDNHLDRHASQPSRLFSIAPRGCYGTHSRSQDTRGNPQQVRSLCFFSLQGPSACSTLTRDLGLLPSFQPLAHDRCCCRRISRTIENGECGFHADQSAHWRHSVE